MLQPKSLLAIAGVQVCKIDDDFKFCVEVIATEKTLTQSHQAHPQFPSASGYAVMKRWAEDYRRVHYRFGGKPIYYLRWDMAQLCVDAHRWPHSLLPRFFSHRAATEEVTQTIKGVSKAWKLLDRDGIPRREASVPERRQVHGISYETMRKCGWAMDEAT